MKSPPLYRTRMIGKELWLCIDHQRFQIFTGDCKPSWFRKMLRIAMNRLIRNARSRDAVKLAIATEALEGLKKAGLFSAMDALRKMEEVK